MPPNANRPPHPRGFSLLELLLVLLILALLAAVAVPALWRGLEGARERALIERLTHWLSAQPREALRAGRPHTPDPADFSDLPTGLTLRFDPAPRYDHRGLATAGLARLHAADGRVLGAWRILAPTGAVQPLGQSEAPPP